MKKLILFLLLLFPIPVNAGIIQDLEDEGVLVLYHDYRAGHLKDLSGNGNDGTGTDIVFQGGGVSFLQTTSVITVSDSSELQLTEGTLVVLGEFQTMGSTAFPSYISKRDGGGTNWHWQYDTAGSAHRIYDGASTRTILIDTTLNNCVAINFLHNTIPEFFVDGVSAGNFNNTVQITVDDAPVQIGMYNSYNNDSGPIYAALIINRKLTATEHSALYAELANLSFPSKSISRVNGSYGVEQVPDDDMETSGTGDWTVGNSATITKENNRVLAGDQVLRVAYNAVNNPYARPNVETCVVGEARRVSGWARGDGTAYPTIDYSTGIIFWTGTTSTDWQYFDTRIVCVSGGILLRTRATAAGYCEFDNFSIREVLAEEVEWKTDWGAHAGNTNFTFGYIENTPFQVASGTWKISTDTINGQTVKVLECVVAGVAYAELSELFHENYVNRAYGTWDWWQYKLDANTYRVGIIDDDTNPTNPTSYRIESYSDESLSIVESGVANILQVSDIITPATWENVGVSRSLTGDFILYHNGVNIGTVNDTSITTADYLVFDFDVGDKIALSAINGDYSIVKYFGVVEP